MQNPTCASPSGKRCTKKWIVSSIAVFVFTFLFDWLAHGVVLMDLYTATATLWRSPADMQAMMPLCIARHLLLAVVFACMYVCWWSKTSFGAVGTSQCPYRKSMNFGLCIGLMLGINAASSYIWMPMPATLAAGWLATETIKWMLAGLVLAVVNGSHTTEQPSHE